MLKKIYMFLFGDFIIDIKRATKRKRELVTDEDYYKSVDNEVKIKNIMKFFINKYYLDPSNNFVYEEIISLFGDEYEIYLKEVLKLLKVEKKKKFYLTLDDIDKLQTIVNNNSNNIINSISLLALFTTTMGLLAQLTNNNILIFIAVIFAVVFMIETILTLTIKN